MTVRSDISPAQLRPSLFIGGEDIRGLGPSLVVEDPFTSEPCTEIATASTSQVEAAVASASAAKERWARTPAAERGRMLHEFATRLRASTTSLAGVMTIEGGKPFVENRDELAQAAGTLDYFAELGRSVAGRLVPPVEPTQLSLVVREPVGVVGCITPWNFPILLLIWKIAPALAAGNTVVCKPSELTPLSTLLLAECVQHFPPGVVNLIAGDGQVGAALVASEGINCIAFTGSVPTGRSIAAKCGERLIRANLELGGNDPFIVCADVADCLDVVADAAAWAAFFNAGQVCAGAERFLVATEVYDEFLEELVRATGRLKLGDPFEPSTDVGPMISATQREKVVAQLDEARRQGGAEILAGGGTPAGISNGYFLSPTVVAVDNTETSLLQDETFGPVAPVLRVADLDDAIVRANESCYGLGSTVFTHDVRNVLRAIRDLRVGMVWINDPLTENDASPFGGVKQSGLGRELGEEGLAAFQDTKRVHLETEIGKKEWWFPYERPD